MSESGLASSRRWINISRMDQCIYNPKQGEYTRVAPGAFVQGGHYAPSMLNVPYFREVTQHLTQKEIYPLIQEETDIDLLKQMRLVEQVSAKRESIVILFDKRIKALTKAPEGTNATNGIIGAANNQGQGVEANRT